ncbi:MAG TPA: hypothetical protein VKR21_11460 [Solirubrobacteraceae bacterium]|nr:hypothetical protein [Solirubrobacteraceae bacterium]
MNGRRSLSLCDEGLSARERSEVLWHKLGFRHLRSINEHRNDTPARAKRCRYFDPYEVVGIIQPTIAIFVGSVEPAGPNQHKRDVGIGQGTVQMLDEVNSKRKRVHVHKDVVAAEPRR